MGKIVQVQVAFWDRVYEYQVGDLKLAIGDQVVVKTEWGTEIGKVIGFCESFSDKASMPQDDSQQIIRKMTTEDSEILAEADKQKVIALDYCKRAIEKYQLPMKVIDAHFSFDGSRLVFPFIADGRVDFRQLVKDLTHHFQKSIRLQQIGIRDEAKISGDYGSCGRKLCCKTHLKELTSVTSELADLQQVAHRGSERLSGLCGRLRCCLAFEEQCYRQLANGLPTIGATVRINQGKGRVISWNILKQSLNVVLEGDEKNIIEVSLKDLK
jgi:cell fate regulator YaaT (PSP1 superfamily)